jgi:Malectin domain
MSSRFMRGIVAALALMLALCGGSPAADADRAVIVRAGDAPPLESLAAREVRRYVYLRTGTQLPIAEAAARGQAIVIAQPDSPLLEPLAEDEEIQAVIAGLKPQDYLLQSVDTEEGLRTVYLIGGSDVGALYAAYRFAEHLGVRFYLHGDVVPDTQTPLVLPELSDIGKPLFALRGIQPFHDFPEGPDWWSTDDYLAIVAQLPKLRMNFLGLHTYPVREPTVWTGLRIDSDEDGLVKSGYPSAYFNTAQSVGWGFTAKNTSDYGCGAAMLFDRDEYGSEIMRDMTPQPEAPEDCNEVFNRVGAMFNDAFTLARQLGVKTCIGTEAPMTVPEPVHDRIGGGAGAVSQRNVSRLYEGTFARIMKTHPLDYYWLWTPEGWTWEDVNEEQVKQTINDIALAHRAAKAVDAPFKLATCGWVLGPQYDRALFDRVLPRDMAVSCINRQVGKDPVDQGFGAVKDREQWAIPWLEDDPAMTSPQLWVARMRRDARDALDYGCTGLMGIHWRTRILGPNVAALAQAAWEQDDWRGNTAGRFWFEGGNTAQFKDTDFAATDDDPLYQSVRWGMHALRMVVPNGTYRVTLHFCEPTYQEEGKRVFSVQIEGEDAFREPLDVFERVEANKALVRTIRNVEVADGMLDIDFVEEVEHPCIAAVAVDGADFSKKINCGGEAYNDYAADAPSVVPDPAAGDFYADWALHEFGPEAAGDAAALFASLDGKLPRPSDWVEGPGGYTPDNRPWSQVQHEYAFVDTFAALRPKVQGAGNLDRFDYWLNTLEFLRATAHMRCAWHPYSEAMAKVRAASDPATKKQLARDSAIPARKALVQVVQKAYRYLLATVSTTGTMGTVCNLEGHTFPAMLDKPGQELEEILGEPLPADAQLARTYEGPARLVVPTNRTSLRPGDALAVKVMVLDTAAPEGGAVYWRVMGQGEFKTVPMERAERATFTAEVPWQDIRWADIEYYVEMTRASGEVLRWPATAPAINQTVVVVPE